MVKKLIPEIQLSFRQRLIKKYVKILSYYESEIAIIHLKLLTLKEEEKNEKRNN